MLDDVKKSNKERIELLVFFKWRVRNTMLVPCADDSKKNADKIMGNRSTTVEKFQQDLC